MHHVLVRLGVVGLSLLWASGCGKPAAEAKPAPSDGGSTAAAAPATEEAPAAPAPTWVTRGHLFEEKGGGVYLCAVGVGSGRPGGPVCVNMGDNRARGELSAYFEVTVARMEEEGSTAHSTYSASILPGPEIWDRYGEGESCYSLACLDVTKLRDFKAFDGQDLSWEPARVDALVEHIRRRIKEDGP